MSNNGLEKVIIGLNDFPVIGVADSLKKALDAMTRFRLGFACIVNDQGVLIGVLTDGDLRRLLLSRQNPLPALLITEAIEFCGKSPKTIGDSASTQECLESMKQYQVTDLPVVSTENKLIGVVHFHNLI